MSTDEIRNRLQRVYASIVMFEKLLDVIDSGRDEPDVWRAADKMLLDMATILHRIAEEVESNYTDSEPDKQANLNQQAHHITDE